MLRFFAWAFCILFVVSGSSAQVYTFTQTFEDPNWLDGTTWTKEGAPHPEIAVHQFSDGDPYLGGASNGSASGGLRGSLPDYGRYTGGDHGQVYLDYHIKVPPGDYTFHVTLDQMLFWSDWLTKNPGQLWGCGQVLYMGDAAEMAYGTQLPNQAPTGPWVAPGYPGAEAFSYMSMGTIWQGSPTNINGIWQHKSHTQMVDGTTIITTTGNLIFRMVMRDKYDISANMSFAMDNLVIELTRQGNCHYPILFDFDDDGDVDMTDFASFQLCYTGMDIDIVGDDCLCLDVDGDNHITELEMAVFMTCANGPSVAADPACDD